MNYLEAAYDEVCERIVDAFKELESLKTVQFINGDIPQKDYEYPYIELDLSEIKPHEKARNGKLIVSLSFEAILCTKNSGGQFKDCTKLGLEIISMLSDPFGKLAESTNIHLMPSFFKKSGNVAPHQGEESRQVYFKIDITIAQTDYITSILDE